VDFTTQQINRLLSNSLLIINRSDRLFGASNRSERLVGASNSSESLVSASG
jgi:hypothetical protein